MGKGGGEQAREKLIPTGSACDARVSTSIASVFFLPRDFGKTDINNGSI